MKKVLILFVVTLSLLIAQENSDELNFEQRMLEQQIKGLKETTQVFLDSVRKHNEATPKKIEAFKNGERLFCENQIVLSKKGWILEGDLLVKDERYYSLDECFLKSK